MDNGLLKKFFEVPANTFDQHHSLLSTLNYGKKSLTHHPISEEKILCRVLSSNWSMDITLL